MKRRLLPCTALLVTLAFGGLLVGQPYDAVPKANAGAGDCYIIGSGYFPPLTVWQPVSGGDYFVCDNGRWLNVGPIKPQPGAAKRLHLDPNGNAKEMSNGSAWVPVASPNGSPKSQTAPAESCAAEWNVAVQQVAGMEQTLRVDYGDGRSEDTVIPAGTGTVTRSFAHGFVNTTEDNETFAQTFTILETRLADNASTLHQWW